MLSPNDHLGVGLPLPPGGRPSLAPRACLLAAVTPRVARDGLSRSPGLPVARVFGYGAPTTVTGSQPSKDPSPLLELCCRFPGEKIVRVVLFSTVLRQSLARAPINLEKA